MRHIKFKRLICKIFGHRFEVGLYESKETVTINNGLPSGCRTKTTRRKKKTVVKHWRKCKRCGAFIKVK